MKVFIMVLLLPQLLWAGFPTQKLDSKVAELVVWKDTGLADTISDWTLYAGYIAPLFLVGNDSDAGKRLLSFAAAHGAAAGVTHLGKAGFDRQRPGKQDFRSFPSGHTSAAWTSAAWVCYLEKSHCSTALLFAGTTGYLRMAGNKHWLSDVLAGAALGWVSGRYIPMQFDF